MLTWKIWNAKYKTFTVLINLKISLSLKLSSLTVFSLKDTVAAVDVQYIHVIGLTSNEEKNF